MNIYSCKEVEFNDLIYQCSGKSYKVGHIKIKDREIKYFNIIPTDPGHTIYACRQESANYFYIHNKDRVPSLSFPYPNMSQVKQKYPTKKDIECEYSCHLSDFNNISFSGTVKPIYKHIEDHRIYFDIKYSEKHHPAPTERFIHNLQPENYPTLEFHKSRFIGNPNRLEDVCNYNNDKLKWDTRMHIFNNKNVNQSNVVNEILVS